MSIASSPGIHHVTAIASDPQRNLDFYTGVLGLRVVKVTVNFDDSGTYHFYFADQSASPGSVLTFFPWPHAKRGRHGHGFTAATAFAVPADSIDGWQRRLAAAGVDGLARSERFGAPVLAFADPDGMSLELVGAESGDSASEAIRRFDSVTLAVRSADRTGDVLTTLLGFKKQGVDGGRTRYAAPGDNGARVIDLIEPASDAGRLGAGIVHHVAFRARTDASHAQIRAAIEEAGFNVTPVLDRSYFRSIYFREPGGVIFEVATDGPGFATDEPADRLGTALRLPPMYESQRGHIEARLPQIRLPGGGVIPPAKGAQA